MKTGMKYCSAVMVFATLGAQLSSGHASETITISARDLIKVERFEPVYQDEKSGRLAYYAVNKSTVRETSQSGLLNGLTKTCHLYADVTNGSGPMQGFCRQEDADSLALVQWSGMCRTGAGNDGKPQTRCWGGWIYLPGGKGRLASIQGGGSWTGVITPAGDFDEEITGTIQK